MFEIELVTYFSNFNPDQNENNSGTLFVLHSVGRGAVVSSVADPVPVFLGHPDPQKIGPDPQHWLVVVRLIFT